MPLETNYHGGTSERGADHRGKGAKEADGADSGAAAGRTSGLRGAEGHRIGSAVSDEKRRADQQETRTLLL